MEEIKKEDLELHSEDTTKVSGGYRPQYYTSNCDVCDCSYKKDPENNPVIPFQGGHLCLNCIKKIEKKLNRKIL